MPDRTCSVDGCGNSRYCRTLCSMHYQRWARATKSTRRFPGRTSFGPPAERFWAKVNKTDTCWLWTAGTDRAGYGVFWPGERGVTTFAHRWSYTFTNGPIPDELPLDHLCRVHNCVRPEHLEAVTGRVNALRGETIAASNAAKTHCPAGHRYDAVNTRIELDGSRKCRKCDAARASAKRRRLA